MGVLNFANIKKTIYYLQRNGLRETWYAISERTGKNRKRMNYVFEELSGMQGILVASKIADRVGITRSVIVNALRKFESAGVIETRSSGMKGTNIRVLNEFVFDEVKKLHN